MPITIGLLPIGRTGSFPEAYTIINKLDPSNGDGIITSVEIWALSNLTGCKIGIFYTTNGDILKCRSAATIGNVTSGSSQTFPIDPGISVETGDYIGIFYITGTIERDSEGFGDIWYFNADKCNVNDEETYTLLVSDAISLYGTGETLAVGLENKSANMGAKMVAGKLI